MRQTLFHIPHELLGWPVFGFGWLFALWLIAGVALLVWLVRRQGWNADTWSYLPIVLVVALAIRYVLPMIEEVSETGMPVGLPIRGYGLMFLLGVVAGVGLSLRLARHMGVPADVVYGLSFHLLLVGIVGARLFYVIQYWPDFQRDNLRETVIAIVNMTQGGLVVYGGLLGGTVGALWFFWRSHAPVLPLADLMTPGMLLGLALGRLGCLMNGCCYGDLCQGPWPAVTFPAANPPDGRPSPPFAHQREQGELWGFRVKPGPDGQGVVAGWVERPGAAALAGLEAGRAIRAINGHAVESVPAARQVLGNSAPDITLETDDGIVRIALGQFPRRSRPVHPSQVYASINAALLCLLAWAYYPFRRRDGEVFAITLTLYPLTRVLEEIIRTDEPGRFGTPLTIAQWVSVLLLLAVAALWVYLARQPRGSVLPAAGPAGE